MPKIVQPDLSIPVYARLKEMILSGELRPGQKIIQERWAEEIGVSRTPLLKALQSLEHEFLVQSVPRKGMYVKQIEVREIIDAFDCREGLEGIAARRAAVRISPDQLSELRSLFAPFKEVGRRISEKKYRQADQRFHRLLIEASHNQILQQIEVLGNVMVICLNRGLVRPPEETLQEHLDIVDAIAKGNGDLAEQRVRTHIRKSRDLMAQSSTADPTQTILPKP
jgi:DNA-binding GntR family transcriptional regulator